MNWCASCRLGLIGDWEEKYSSKHCNFCILEGGQQISTQYLKIEHCPIQLWWSHFAKLQMSAPNGAWDEKWCWQLTRRMFKIKASTVKCLQLLSRQMHLHCRVKWPVELWWMPPAKDLWYIKTINCTVKCLKVVAIVF